MPKQILQKPATKLEKQSYILSIIALGATFLFGASTLMLVTAVNKNDGAASLWSVFVFITFAMFFGISVAHCVHGVRASFKTDNYLLLFCGVLTAISAFSSLLNVRLAMILGLAALHKEDTAATLLGKQSMEEFLADQRSAWIFLTFGIAAGITVGIIGIIKLYSALEIDKQIKEKNRFKQ